MKAEICNPELIEKYKMSNKYFTRTRKQTFSTTLLLMMNFLRKSLSLEIENFVKHIKIFIGNNKLTCFTKSAFVQCRNKIHPEVFKHLNNRLINEFYTDNDASIKLWKGFRLLSVDGSRMTLPNTDELREEYGQTKNQNPTGVTQARVSVLYDVLNNFVLDGQLTPLSVGELPSAIKHLQCTRSKDLIIYDRGYPSFKLIFEHYHRNIDFVIRAKKDFNNEIIAFYEGGTKTKIVKIYPGKNTKISDKPYNYKTHQMVRLVRVELPNGESEILITSLLDNVKYPSKIFKDLYFQRWGVEKFYDEFKNKLKAEHFSGYSKHSILQDFYVALFVSNIQSLIVGEINEELQIKSKTKYVYKVNNNLSYGLLKDRIVTLFYSDTKTETIFSELKELFNKHLIPIRPDRKFKRHKDKYRSRQKPKVPKNMKDTL
ncbi:MAG: IS4 family transposase [Flavobacterium sp.]